METHRRYLDFKSIKTEMPMSAVLDAYGVRLKRINQSTLRGDCPLPSHTSDSRGTFYVNEAKSVWCCHSDSCKNGRNRCGGNIIDFVSVMESLSPYDAARHLITRVAAKSPPPSPRGAEGWPSVRSGEREPAEPPPRTNLPLGFALKDIDHGHPMIIGRRISVEIARLFGNGFFPGKGSMAGRIVFPLEENGMLVGYAGRTTRPVSSENPKWLLGKGVKKTFLYGLERCDPQKPVVLVQSH